MARKEARPANRMPYTVPSGVSRIAYRVRRPAPPAIARLTRLIVSAATSDRRRLRPGAWWHFVQADSDDRFRR